MVSNKNIFCVSNPAKMIDALFSVVDASGVDLQDILIFLPSRRALRSVEKALVKLAGHALILPNMVALGEGVDDTESDDEFSGTDIISNLERVVVIAKLLSADANIRSLANALPIAQDLVRMQDYMENEGVNPADIDWIGLVDEKYAAHFQSKAKMLGIMSGFMNEYGAGRITNVQKRNADIRAWINELDKYKLVIVCGSTASVPPTADLMASIASRDNGRIILSGKIDGNESDFELPTNPYNAEYKFLKRIGYSVADVQEIDVGGSAIDFLNYSFGNDTHEYTGNKDLSHCHLVECATEAIEAASVAEIAARAMAQNKSVLVITPDAAANQRIGAALAGRGIVADFSGGVSGTRILAARAILNLLDEWVEKRSDEFDKSYQMNNSGLFNTIAAMVQKYDGVFAPGFVADDAESVMVWAAIRDLSNVCKNLGIDLSVSDARAFIYDILSAISVRAPQKQDATVSVIGTIESRMQTADVVILTGLNDGMFPARGYENAWLPRRIAEEIGIPSPDRKVSLHALDFMNLSCGGEVYWLRSRVSGGVQTSESRFLSRIIARKGVFDRALGTDIINAVLANDDVPYNGLDYAPPVAESDWSDVYVTHLEHLIHNPFSYYVKHILKLKVLDDWWLQIEPGAFGSLVHDVIEHATDLRPDVLVAQMDARAMEKLGRNSVLFHFWHNRFLEIAPLVSNVLTDIQNRYHEIEGSIKIPVGNAYRTVRARADMVWSDGVMDFKTGAVPNKSQLEKGNMPQLPIEALILQSGGFQLPPDVKVTKTPMMSFLHMKNGSVSKIDYDPETTQKMIDAAVNKIIELFNIYTVGNAPYEYHETGDIKYQAYDDLARVKD